MDREQGSPKMREAIDEELRKAFDRLGATSLEMRDAKSGDPQRAYDRLRLLGARSDLLRIVGSINDTMSDVDVLRQMKLWNETEE